MLIPRFVAATALILAVAAPARAEDALIIVSGEYTVDAVAHTAPQQFSFIVVGEGAAATLHVRDGRLVRSSGSVQVGFTTQHLGSGTGVVNVLGNHSALVAAGIVHLAVNNLNLEGRTSAGTLNVGAGSLVRAGGLRLGFGDPLPTRGTVSLSGAGAHLETTGEVSMNGGDSLATIAIGPGATMSVGTSISAGTGARIDVDGGRLSLPGPGALPPPGVIRLNGGSYRFRSGQTLDGTPGFYTDTYGSPPVLRAEDPGLIIDGTTTLAAPLAFDGGSLRTGRIAVEPAAGSVLLAGGTLTLTGDGAVLDDGSDFGPDPLTVGDGTGGPARLVLRSAGTMLLGEVAVLADGALSFSGGALVLDSLDNGGNVTLIGSTLRSPGGLLNNGSLRLIDAVIDADVISPTGSTIDVAGTVVFNGAFAGAAAFRGSGTVVFNPPASGD